MLKVAHQDYINNLLDPQTDTNSRNLWRYLKATRQDNVGVSTLKSDGKLITDPAGKAEALNQQFSSAFTREDPNNIPELGPSPYQTMDMVNISRTDVEKLLARLNPAKASGPDKLSARFLKETAAQISPMYAFLFQQSIDQGTVPADWKTANVAPIFKKGDRGLASNYRPVSLTCISCKVLEHIIVSQMRDHMDQHNILVDCQHGFRSRHSCESQLIITAHDLASSLNQKHQTDMAILDFSKAFNRVPHTRLKAKLDHYGIRGNTLKWISSFLDGRTQKVMVDGSISNECPVLSGVPQGSVLGPTLFLLYINDITHQLDSRVRLFADDCLIYREIQSPDDHRILQQDLDRLTEWSHQWQMSFNTAKCYVMRISLATKNISRHDYLMEGNSLELKDDHPHLGVQLSSKLSWECHINLVTAKATRALGFLRRNLVACDRSAKEKAYFALMRPLTEYCCVVWSPHQQKLKNKLEKVQCSAARFVANRPYRRRDPDSVTEILNELGWRTLEDRRSRARLTSMYKMTNNLVAIPETYHPAPKTTARTRRTNHHQFSQYQANILAYQHSFIPGTIPKWNLLPEAVAGAPSLDQFKASLAQTSLQ